MHQHGHVVGQPSMTGPPGVDTLVSDPEDLRGAETASEPQPSQNEQLIPLEVPHVSHEETPAILEASDPPNVDEELSILEETSEQETVDDESEEDDSEEEQTTVRRSRRTPVPKTIFTIDKLGGNPSWSSSNG